MVFLNSTVSDSPTTIMSKYCFHELSSIFCCYRRSYINSHCRGYRRALMHNTMRLCALLVKKHQLFFRQVPSFVAGTPLINKLAAFNYLPHRILGSNHLEFYCIDISIYCIKLNTNKING